MPALTKEKVSTQRDTQPQENDIQKDSVAHENNIFWLSESENGELLLLGCPLKLTSRELGVLMSIIEHYPSTATVKDICYDCEGLSAGSVPVHIYAINRKAALIGGRKLVIARRGKGYILNKHM